VYRYERESKRERVKETNTHVEEEREGGGGGSDSEVEQNRRKNIYSIFIMIHHLVYIHYISCHCEDVNIVFTIYT